MRGLRWPALRPPLAHRLRPSPPVSVEQRNQRLMSVEGIGIGLAIGVGTFLPVFLLRLGASDLLIGLLTAIPSLAGILLAMPVGEFLARQPHIVPWYSRARLSVLSCYALTGLVPFFFTSHRPEAIILIWALAAVPQIFTGVSLTAVMGAVAGPRGRLALASKRWSIFGLVSALTLVIAGQVLRRLEFPLNYQVVFISSAVGALISYITSSRVELPTSEVTTTRQPIGQVLRQHISVLRGSKRFLRFTASQFVFQWGLLLPVPLFPIYWVRSVQASDAAISAISTVQTVVTIAAYFLWARASRLGKERHVLLVSSLGLSFYPLLTALTPRVEPLVLWAALAGFFAAGVNLVFFDALLGTCPAERQTTYIGMYQTTVYIAGLLAPVVGIALASAVGIVPALVLGTALRLAGFVLMAMLGVGKAEPIPSEEEATA